MRGKEKSIQLGRKKISKSLENLIDEDFKVFGRTLVARQDKKSKIRNILISNQIKRNFFFYSVLIDINVLNVVCTIYIGCFAATNFQTHV